MSGISPYAKGSRAATFPNYQKNKPRYNNQKSEFNERVSRAASSVSDAASSGFVLPNANAVSINDTLTIQPLWTESP